MVIDLVCSYFCCLLRAKQGRATGKEQKAFSNAWVTLAIVTHPDRAKGHRTQEATFACLAKCSTNHLQRYEQRDW